jgi:phage protein D
MASAAILPLPLQSARPVVEIGGERQPAIEAAMLSLEIADRIEGMARAEIVLGNWGGDAGPGFRHFDRQVIEFGKPVTVTLGGETLFDGRIGAITADYPDGGPPTIGLLAEDRLQDLRMTRRTRVFVDASLVTVARKIAADHGLDAQADLDSPTTPLLAQVNQSDLAFLLDCARREDAVIWVEGGTLHAAAARPDDRVELRWAGTLREFHVTADLADQRTAVVAAGWDVGAKETASNRATAAAIGNELGGTESGAAILAQTLGERADAIVHGLPHDAAEARALAEASFRYAARRFVTGEGVAQTSAALRVGARLALSGLGPLFDGDYCATRVTHRFDLADGLRTEFACERPGMGRP